MEPCVAEYMNDIESASDMLCELLKEDLGDKAWEYAQRTVAWDSVADWIVGDPDVDAGMAELYAAVAEAAQGCFRTTLLGTY